MAKDLDSIKTKFHSGSYVPFTLEDVSLKWCRHLGTPDTEFDSVGKYKATSIINETTAEEMKEIGFNVKETSDGEHYIVSTRLPQFDAPTVIDEKGNEIDPRTVGDGTVADVYVKAKSFTIGKKTHLPTYIEKIVVKDLVVFGDGGGTESDGTPKKPYNPFRD